MHNDPNAVNNPVLDAALTYAAAGVPVLPCEPSAKSPVGTLVPPDRSPRGRGYVKGSGGSKKASRDPDTIRDWWALRPDAMIGLAMGAVSGLFVVDLDAPKQIKCGPLGTMTPDGLGNWKEFGITRETYEVATPGGGRHIYYRYDMKRPVSCKEGALKGLGINVRGDGGYVIAPPSCNGAGGLYRPANGHLFTDAAEAPEELYRALGSRRGGKPRGRKPKDADASADASTGSTFDDLNARVPFPKTPENIEMLRGAPSS